MRARLPLSVRCLPAVLAVAGVLACVGAPGARAQVSVDPRALEPLSPPPAKPPADKPVVKKPTVVKPTVVKPTTGKPVPAAPAKLPAVIVPTAPPPPPVLPPPFVVPTRPPPPPLPTPITADAPDTATRAPGGMRITFGADRADLNPASAAAIADLVRESPTPDTSYTVTAYATGGDDPSLPRRMSLSRALSVRSALMEAGVASVRIYVKALGASSPLITEGPPDRVDIVVTQGQMPAAASPPAASPPAASPPPAIAPPKPAPIQKAAP